MNIIQIVPRLYPMIDGVGDYSLRIAELLRQRGIDTDFVVADPEWRNSDFAFPVHTLKRQSPQELYSVLQNACGDKNKPVLLQFSGYGYEARGCPAWLADGLRNFILDSKSKLLTMFHETYASSVNPATSSFWNQHFQFSIFKKTAEMSDVIVTSNDKYEISLKKCVPSKAVSVMPVISGVGEPSSVPGVEARDHSAVFFGKDRTVAVRKMKKITDFIASAGIKKIYDIGKIFENEPHFSGCEYVAVGEVSQERVSELLLKSRWGFVDCVPEVLGKSSVFAAYAAHGLISVLIGTTKNLKPQERDPKYIILDHPRWDFKNLQNTANAARSWYEQHNSSRAAEFWADVIKKFGESK